MQVFFKLQDLEYWQRQDCIVVTVDETTKKLNVSLPKDLRKKGLKKNWNEMREWDKDMKQTICEKGDRAMNTAK